MPRNARRHLPSLGAFATFEVAAKHLSFTAAAKELNVTQAAVSQQIRTLEDALENRLFRRKHNALELTEEGAVLLRAVTQGLDIVTSAVSFMRDEPQESGITIAATIGVATHWIKPLIRDFRAHHPDAQFTILASDEDQGLQNAAEVDIAFICGNDRSHAGDELYYLFPEMVQPVCSPDYLHKHGPFDDPESLKTANLMHLHDKHWYSGAINWQPLTWHSWFQSLGVDYVPSASRLVTNCNPILVEAACQGEGLILGWRHIVAEHLRTGQLCTAHPHMLCVERANFLKVNDRARTRQDVRTFVNFVLGTSSDMLNLAKSI